MKPIKFPEQNSTYAKDQPQYNPLPTYKTKDGKIISCWKMSFRERIKTLFTGQVWLSVHTFNRPLQPLRMSVYNPLPEWIEVSEVMNDE